MVADTSYPTDGAKPDLTIIEPIIDRDGGHAVEPVEVRQRHAVLGDVGLILRGIEDNVYLLYVVPESLPGKGCRVRESQRAA